MTKARKTAMLGKAASRRHGQASLAQKRRLQAIFQHGPAAATEQAARQLIGRFPQEGYAWKVLGIALQQQGRLSDALTALQQAVALWPEDAETHSNLGQAQWLAGHTEAAEASLRAAIALSPQNFALLNYLGGFLKDQGRFAEGEPLIRRALALKPDYASAHLTLGALLKDAGRLAEAEQATRQALALAPDHAHACLNLGATLQEMGRLQEAFDWTEKALRGLPDNTTGLNNLCLILNDLRQYEKALAVVRRLVALQPEVPVGWCHLSVFQRELGEALTSDQAIGKAMALAPEEVAYRLRHAVGVLPIVPDDVAQAQHAVTEFTARVQALRAWLDAAPVRRQRLASEVGIVQPFHLAYRPGNHCAALSAYGDLLTRAFAEIPQKLPRVASTARGKIRLLIISAHLFRHSVWDVLLKGLVRHLDRSKFELVLYQLGKQSDEESRWAYDQADRWRDLGTVQGNDAWLAAVQEDAPDIIYYPEIGMNPTTVFLAAQRLAPLQVVGWGHPITSGLATMDCYLSGELLEGPAAAAHYREKLIELPGTGCCTELIDIAPQAAPELDAVLAALPRPWFVIPQRHFKFDPADDGLFAEIAARVGECSFLIPQSTRAHWATERVLERMGKAFRAKGLAPERYLKIFPELERGKFYTLLDQCDVFLDCPSFSGYTTAWQAAHRGLPIVTLAGEFMRQRLAAGLLRQIEQTDTIAESRPAYVDLAVRLAKEVRDEPARYAQRRVHLKTAAARADHRVEVVRAFEAHLIDELAARQALPQSLAGNATPYEEPSVAEPTFDYPWQQLDADLHFHSLKHDYAPAGLLQMVSTPPREVLDVGCFCGGSGRWLKTQFPTARVTGVEMLDKAAAIAREAYDEVHVGKFEDIDLSAWQGKFDAIIAADVLEHMYNPWAVLQKLSPLLAPGGAIYISLPNIRNLNILRGLAGGEWRYAGAGILDITHIRFFTRAQILEMLAQTGWQAQEVKFNLDPRLMPSFKDVDLSTIQQINAGKLKLENLSHEDVLELLALQFFIRATPANTPGVTA